MIYVLSALIVLLLGIIALSNWQHANQVNRLLNHQTDFYKEWDTERKQLLDRIQAPSYDHLKHHEVKIIKAQNNEKEPPKLEVL
jgi:hypothetical protein